MIRCFSIWPVILLLCNCDSPNVCPLSSSIVLTESTDEMFHLPVLNSPAINGGGFAPKKPNLLLSSRTTILTDIYWFFKGEDGHAHKTLPEIGSPWVIGKDGQEAFGVDNQHFFKRRGRWYTNGFGCSCTHNNPKWLGTKDGAKRCKSCLGESKSCNCKQCRCKFRCGYIE